jgi:hypothetical protein
MKLHKKFAIRGMAILVLAGMLLAACAPGSAVGPAAPTQSDPATSTTVPTNVTTSPVVDTPTGMPVSTPTGGSTAPQPPVVALIQQHLSSTLNIAADQIKIVSVEPVDWPDSCLGVQKPDEMCAQMVTAGYKIVLAAGGKKYEYHTNQDGSEIRMLDDAAQGGQSAGNLPPAAVVAQNMLAQQLGVAADTVKTIKVEQVEWPDGCLGVQKPGVMCTQVITPGYLVLLSVNGKQYEFHTDTTGRIVVQATAPFPQSAEKVVVWEQTENSVCNRVEIGSQNVSYGACSGSMQMAEISGLRVDELTYLVSTYTSFTAETKAGSVQFTGQGEKKPTDAEKRSVAEWARLVFMEAQGGRSGAAWGMAFSWHREGGIAGFCDDLTVYQTGWGMPTSCKSGQARASKEYRLSASELDQLYTWIDQFANFDYEQKDAATADAMQVKLAFEGKGAEKATTAQQEQIAGFAGQLFANAAK